VASELRLALGRGTLTPLLGLQESADVLGSEPRQLVPVGLRLAVVLNQCTRTWVSVHRFAVPGHHSSPSGRTRRITTGMLLPIDRCGMLGCGHPVTGRLPTRGNVVIPGTVTRRVCNCRHATAAGGCAYLG
jgi:hypothetical protein